MQSVALNKINQLYHSFLIIIGNGKNKYIMTLYLLTGLVSRILYTDINNINKYKQLYY